MSDYTATFRWMQENIDWCDVGLAEQNDRALEQWLNAPPNIYTPTALLDDGSVPSWASAGVGYWARQRAQFILAAFIVPVTGLAPISGKKIGVSMPTAPAPLTPPAGSAWWFPIGGNCVCWNAAVTAATFQRIGSFNIVSGTTYYLSTGLDETAVRVSGSGSTLVGVGMYRESV